MLEHVFEGSENKFARGQKVLRCHKYEKPIYAWLVLADPMFLVCERLIRLLPISKVPLSCCFVSQDWHI